MNLNCALCDHIITDRDWLLVVTQLDHDTGHELPVALAHVGCWLHMTRRSRKTRKKTLIPSAL